MHLCAFGKTSLNAEAVAADKKSCKRFGPCGVGKEALFLNSYFIDRRYYVAFSSVRRVFKRVAMSQGGFSGKGVFGAIPYLVVQYDGGKEKQCTFKREEDAGRDARLYRGSASRDPDAERRRRAALGAGRQRKRLRAIFPS